MGPRARQRGRPAPGARRPPARPQPRRPLPLAPGALGAPGARRSRARRGAAHPAGLCPRPARVPHPGAGYFGNRKSRWLRSGPEGEGERCRPRGKAKTEKGTFVKRHAGALLQPSGPSSPLRSAGGPHPAPRGGRGRAPSPRGPGRGASADRLPGGPPAGRRPPAPREARGVRAVGTPGVFL